MEDIEKVGRRGFLFVVVWFETFLFPPNRGNHFRELSYSDSFPETPGEKGVRNPPETPRLDPSDLAINMRVFGK